MERTGHINIELAPWVATDILVYTPAEWQRIKDRPFIQQALAEGSVL